MIATWSILSVGFLIASIVPPARFAQPIGAVILYPMLALSDCLSAFGHARGICRQLRRFVLLPMRFRCCAESGEEMVGACISVMSALLHSYSSSARLFHLVCFAGSSGKNVYREERGGFAKEREDSAS